MKRSLVAIIAMAVLALSPASAFASESILSEAEQLQLKSILTCVSYVGEGVDKKPTIKVSGCNVQIVNGTGSESSPNGEGNLVIGYDESPGTQSGSHNLILGTDQTYEDYGSIVGGEDNADKGPFSVVFGYGNTVYGEASILGGEDNLARGHDSIVGGNSNVAEGQETSILGGTFNHTEGEDSTISGGGSNKTEWGYNNASILGGHSNVVSEDWGMFP